jgi:GNAT superfamily N-acetyltransferase
MGQPVNLTYSILLVIAALVSATVMVLTWHRRPGPGTVPLALLMLALTWWGLTYALHWSGFYRPTMFFWLDATYLGVVIVPVAFLAFALQFTNRDHWLNRRNMALMTLQHGGKSAWLDELYVAPEYRGKGIGAALLRAALETAQRSGCAAVDLEVDEAHARAENLHKREGFEPLHRTRWVKKIM